MSVSQSTILALASLTMLGLASARPAAAQHVYDASADFSATSNPNPFDGGVWSYGYEATLGGSLTLFTTKTGGANSVSGWSTGAGLPHLDDNQSGSVYTSTQNGSTLTIQPNQLILHPGPNGQYSVLRFTAPATSTYSFSGSFNGADTHPTTTDVHVLLAGTAIADGGININGLGNTASLTSSSLALTKGQTLDFAVGFGNNSYTYDTTGLFAKVTDLSAPASVPEASTTVSLGLLLALGLGGVLIAHKKRANS